MVKEIQVTFVVESSKAAGFLESALALLEATKPSPVSITKADVPAKDKPKLFANRVNPKPAVSPVEAPKAMPGGNPTLDPPVYCDRAGNWQEVDWDEVVGFGKPGHSWYQKTWREIDRKTIEWLHERIENKADPLRTTGLTNDMKDRIKAVYVAYQEDDKRPRDAMPEEITVAS